jgi:hypothetical protein
MKHILSILLFVLAFFSNAQNLPSVNVKDNME